MARKEPRKLLIQPHMHSTEAGDGVVSHQNIVGIWVASS